MLQRLQQTFGVDGNAHRWFRSYLDGRIQYVRRGALRSPITRLLCSVLLGPVLGLFIVYTFDLIQPIEGHGLAPNLYTNNTQVSGSCHTSNVVNLRLPEIRCQLDEVEQASINLIKD